MSKLTPEQQLDVLWKALKSPDFWCGVDLVGQLTLSENLPSRDTRIGAVLHCFKGSRETCIEQLLALQVADRLDGKVDEPGLGASPGVYDDLGPDSYF